MSLNVQVRAYWEQEPCGTGPVVVGTAPRLTPEWFAKVEENRYAAEPFIHAVAQFSRHRGKKVLEIGVGAGTDHLQWARAGAECYGVDLTDAAIETTRAHLAAHGLQSRLTRLDAEELPFPDGQFDVVYSWGVIHHSESPERVVREVRRVLRPGGVFLGMLYGRRSLAVLRLWVQYALLRGRPWRSFRDVVWNHVESIGTRAYTSAELRRLFADFHPCTTTPYLTASDTHRWPRWLHQFFPDVWGWFIGVKAIKPGVEIGEGGRPC